MTKGCAWKLITVVAIVLLSSGCSQGGVDVEQRVSVPEDGLLGYWEFESVKVATGVVLDQSSHSRNGTAHGAFETASGVVGNSLRFGEQGGHVKIPARDLDFTGDFTLAAWFNPYTSSFGRGQQMIMAKNVYNLNQREWSLVIDDNNRIGVYIFRDGWQTVHSTTVPQEGHWYHVAVVMKNGTVELYINGKMENSARLGAVQQNTAAPVTLGAVDNNGHIMQQFFGALDTVCIFDRALNSTEIEGLIIEVADTHIDLISPWEPYDLWDPEREMPKYADIQVLQDVDFHVIKPFRFEEDGYRFHHGVALAWHKDRLYASFGMNQYPENEAGEEALGKVSDDGGKTWSDLFVIQSGSRQDNFGVSHGVFLSHNDELWAFHGAFATRLGDDTHTRAYRLDETEDNWEYMGRMLDGFFPLQEPQKMSDGNWIMGGVRSGGQAAVAVSQGADITSWQLVAIPGAPGRMWGESSVILNDNQVTNIARYSADSKLVALVAISYDYGRTWTASEPTNLLMAATKPYTGTLSTGENYLISTTTADSGNARRPLTIALTRPGEDLFRQVYVIRHALFPEGAGESHRNASLAYPYAVEYQGHLYVGYSNSGGGVGRVGEGKERWNNNSIELAIIPLEALEMDE